MATARSSREIRLSPLASNRTWSPPRRELAAALAGFEEHRRAEEHPVQSLLAAQLVEGVGGAEGALLPLLGEFRAVHQALAGGDLQAPGAAENQQARHAGAFHAVENGLAAGGVAGAEVGAAPAAVESADDHLVACHGAGHLGRVADVRLHYAEAVARRQLARVADQGGYRVAALQGFVEEIVADVTGGADQGDFHAAPSVREMPQSGVDQHHPPCARRDKPLRGGCTR